MAKLTLPSGDVMLYDECDQWLVDKYRWHIGNKGYARTGIYKNRKPKWLYFHKIVLDCPKGMMRDHISRNRLDNRRHNLRIVTPQQNTWNKDTKRKDMFPVGVHLFQGKYFRVKIQGEWIGYFKDIYQAALAYDREAKKRYGEFANLNCQN